MKKRILKLQIILVIFFTNNLYSWTFDNQQISLLNDAYNIGNIVKTSDGMNFGETLASILYVESSVRLGLIGDKYLDTGKLKPVRESSLGAFQIKLGTAKEIIRKNPILKKTYSNLLLKKNESELIDKLLGNIKFSALIAAHYLKMNYEYAQRLNKPNPYFKTISKYNGGWNNKDYYSRVQLRHKEIKELIRQGKIKSNI